METREKNDEVELAAAERRHVPRIMELIEQARAFLKNSGVDQWQDGYPDQACIEKDIENGTGYLCLCREVIVGYLCVDFNGEPAYEGISGAWLDDRPYVVVHRMALDGAVRGRGLASRVFRLVEDMSRRRNVYSFRIDTDAANAVMKHLLQKNGFRYCGIIRFQNSEKIAYQKSLDD